MSEDTILEFDGSPVEEAFDKIVRAYERYNAATGRFVSITESGNQAGENYAVTLRAIGDEGEKLTVKLKQVGEELQEVSRSFTVGKAGPDLNAQVEAYKAYGKQLAEEGKLLVAHQLRFLVMLDQGDAERKQVLASNAQDFEDHRAKVIASQEKLAAQLAEAAKEEQSVISQNQLKIRAILAQGEADTQAHREKYFVEALKEIQQEIESGSQLERISELGLQARKEINAANEAEEKRHVEALWQSQRARLASIQTAGTVGQDLSQGDTSTASRTEYQRYIGSVGRMVEIVEKSGLTIDQVNQVIRNTVDKTGQVYTGVYKQIADAHVQVVNAERNLGAEVRSEAKRNVQEGTRLLITWQDIVRFVQFRLAYAIGFQLVGALRDASQEVRQFEIRISEIRTLSQEAGTSFDGWFNIVRKLSDQFGASAEDVAKGIYETISNQIARGTEAATFMAAAMKFAQVTVSSTADSVNLLSSAINSYHLSASEADRIGAIFFKTIDEGRVTASEMGNTLGRILPTAALLGVSFEEVNAAIATLTISGVKYNEAFTLINNVMQKLNRPSKELSEIFKKWGVETGEAAIQSFGFDGVLRKIAESANGSSAELAELFTEMRSFRGAVGLTSALDKYEATLARMRDNVLPSYNRAFVISQESSGRIVEKELNRIRNFFLVDFGKPLVDALAGVGGGGALQSTFATLVNTVGGLTGGIQKLTEATKYALTGFVAWKTAGVAVSLWQNQFKDILAGTAKVYREQLGPSIVFAKDSLGLTGGPLKAASLGFASLRTAVLGAGLALKTLATPELIFTGVALVYTYWKDRQAEIEAQLREAQQRGSERYQAETADAIKAANDAYSERVRIIQQATDEEFKIRNQGIAKVRSAADAFLEAQKDAIKEYAKYVNDTFQLQISTLQAGLAKLQASATQAAETARRARESSSRLSENQEDRNLSFGLKGLSPVDELQKRIQLAQQLKSEGLELLRRASDGSNLGDPKEAGRLLDDGNKKISKSLDLLSAVADRREEIQARIKKLQQEQDDLNRKGSERSGVTNLQSQLTEASRRGRPQREVDDLRAQIAAARAKNGNADSAAKQDEVGAELADLQRQLAAVTSLGDGISAINDLYTEQKRLLDAIAGSQEKQAAAAQAQANAEKERIERLQTAFKEIVDFKLPKDFEKSGANPLAGLDEKIKAVNAAGLTDQSVLFQIAQLRTKIEQGANVAIENHRLKVYAEGLTKQKAAFQKQQTELTEERGKTQINDQNNYVSLVGQLNELQVRLRRDLESRRVIAGQSRGGGDAGVDQAKGLLDSATAIQQNLTQLQEAASKIAALQAENKRIGSDPLQVATVQKNQAEIERLKYAQSTTSLPQEVEKLRTLLGQVLGTKGGDADTSTRVAQIAATLDNLKGSTAQKTALEANQAALEATLAQNGVEIAKALSKQAALAKETGDFSAAFNLELQKNSNSLQELQQNIDLTSERLRGLLGNQPTPNFVRPSAGAGGPVSYNSSSNLTDYGGITVNVYVPPGAPVDGQAVATGLRNAIRRGQTASLA